MPAGRPTNYTPELVQLARDYIQSHEGDAVPSIAGLCCAINIHRSTAYAWAKDKDKEFSDILEEIMQKQENTLISKGLKSEFNSTITKLMLTKHGYHDKQDVDHSGNFNVNMPPKDAGTL